MPDNTSTDQKRNSFYIHLSPERCGPFQQSHSHTAGCAQLPWTIALIFLIPTPEWMNYSRLFQKAASAITVSAPFTSLPSCLFPYSLGQPDSPLHPLHSCLPRSRGLPLFLVASTEQKKKNQECYFPQHDHHRQEVEGSFLTKAAFYKNTRCFKTPVTPHGSSLRIICSCAVRVFLNEHV